MKYLLVDWCSERIKRYVVIDLVSSIIVENNITALIFKKVDLNITYFPLSVELK